jgi:hypothetical protein
MGTRFIILAAGLLLCASMTRPALAGIEERPDIEHTTVTGIVEEVNREDLTVTILTDSGRLLSLSAAGNDVIATLHAGDRVQIQIVADDEAAPDEMPSVESGKTEI